MPARNFNRRATRTASSTHSRIGTRIKEAKALDIEDLDATKQLTDASISSHPTHNPPTPDRETAAINHVQEEPSLQPDGHVKVGVRVKPSWDRETGEFELEVHPTERTVRVPRSYLNSKKYTFDAVFPDSASAEQVYREMVRPLVQQVVAGYSAAVTAFGPRGSGKTRTIGAGGHSMWEGAIAFSCADLLTAVKEHTDWRLLASYAEVEPAGAADLLVSRASRPTDLNHSRVKEAADRFGPKAGGLGTINCREIKEVEECLEIVRQGNLQRENQTIDKKGGANYRGNVIFRLQLIRPAQVGEDKKWMEAAEARKSGGRMRALHSGGGVVSSLLLVDLAGSERTRSSLGTVKASETKSGWESRAVASLVDAVSNMGGIRKNQESVGPSKGRAPLWVRETALTWLLKDALFGRAWWAVLVTVKAGGENLREEDSAMLFGERVRLGRLRPVWNLASDWNAVQDGTEGTEFESLSPNPFLKASVFHKSLSPRRLGSQSAEDPTLSKRSTARRRSRPTPNVEAKRLGSGYASRKGGSDAAQSSRAWEREHADVDFSHYVQRSLEQRAREDEDEDEDIVALLQAVRAEKNLKAESFVSNAPWPEWTDSPKRSPQGAWEPGDDTANPRAPSHRASTPTGSAQALRASGRSSPGRKTPLRQSSASPSKAAGGSKRGSAAKEAGVRQAVEDLLDAHGMLVAGEGTGVERALEAAEGREPTRSFLQLVHGVVERPALLASLLRLRGPGAAQAFQTAGYEGRTPEKPAAKRRLLAPMSEEEAAAAVRAGGDERFGAAGEAGEAWLLQKLNGIASAAARQGSPRRHAGASPHRGSRSPYKASPAGSRQSPGGRRSSPGAGRGGGGGGGGRRGLWGELQEIESARREDEAREAGLREVVAEAEQLAHSGGDATEGVQGALLGRREALQRVRGLRAAVVSAAAVCEALLHALDTPAPLPPAAHASPAPRAPVTQSTGHDLQAKPREDDGAEPAAASRPSLSPPRGVRSGGTDARRRQSWPPGGTRVLTPAKKPPEVRSPEARRRRRAAERAAAAAREGAESVAKDDAEAKAREALLAEFGRERARELVRASMGMVQGFFGRCREELLEKRGKDSAVKGAGKRSMFGWKRK